MKRTLILSFFSVLYSISSTFGQNDPIEKGLQSINRNVIQSQLEFLSSDWMEGRRAGEKGELLASDYIAGMLQLYGVKPWGDLARTSDPSENPSFEGRTYFQNFSLIKTTTGPDNSLKLTTSSDGSEITTVFAPNIDFILRPSESSETEAGIVFAGYGFVDNKTGFNELEKKDIKGRFVLKITGNPAFAEAKLSKAEIMTARREFDELARKYGAAGIIEVNPDADIFGSQQRIDEMAPSEKTPRPYNIYADYSLSDAEPAHDIIHLYVSLRTAKAILDGTGNSIEDYRKMADSNQKYDFQAIDKNITIKTSVKKEIIPVRNVLGIIEGNKKDEIIVLGAHYDHMGMNNGYIWNGADDNGSGTVGVMTLAKAIIETGKKPDKTIVIALWTAEEEGLLGSRYFVKNLSVPKQQIRLNVNFDMISRYVSEDDKKKVVMTYTDSQKSFREITSQNLKKFGIDLDIDYQPSSDPPGGTDHRSFVAAGIPILRFKPGHREEYHTPDDEISVIDWDIMEKIIRISFADVWQLANSEW
ncbi:MAG TPA: M20/M25/M40 family metallo-hydrolase [Bacteroidales bacterium]|nr:M20/M25/M40 family metallo-hydrolase [Bacteroidales bacterium]